MVRDLVKAVLQQEVIKVQNQDLDIPKNLVLKVDKCHCKEEFQNLDLKILTGNSFSALLISFQVVEPANQR